MGTANEPDARQGIQSVEIAMTVLQALEQGRGPMSLTQLGAACGMAASKVHRYLVSLGRAGLVSQSRSSGLYDFGPAVRRLGIEALRRMDEVGIAGEFLPGLRDRTNHAVNLAVWGDNGPVVVRWDYGSYALPITVRIGATLPMLASSIGRVYLAHLPETLTEPVLRGELADSEKRPAAELAAIRAEVRKTGVAITSGGVVPGVTSIAAPVLTSGSPLPVVVAVVMPARHATGSSIESASAALLETVRAIADEMGA
ncbi:IclR family transcriptional regulator [Streptomyces sp. NPDC096311]|uniref:IclR family transcriptional regulator n=1 Tax=Streptomyces sp. NPDC096311 TaxID=3366083 RepID=UPI003806D838